MVSFILQLDSNEESRSKLNKDLQLSALPLNQLLLEAANLASLVLWIANKDLKKGN
jgi:hypothetical protein